MIYVKVYYNHILGPTPIEMDGFAPVLVKYVKKSKWTFYTQSDSLVSR